MNVDEVIRSRQFLSEIGVWPSPRQLDIEGWLNNYSETVDKSIAHELLDAHVHLNEEQIVQAVASSIRSLSALPRFGDSSQRRESWASYLDEVIVSFPLAQEGDPTASGYIFARLASEKLGFPESRVRSPEQVVRSLAASDHAVDVLMLDDITASGTQFLRSWTRKTVTPNGRFSLADMALAGKISSTYYLPVVSTAHAKAAIEAACDVEVVPSYLLTSDYSALDADTRLVPEELRPDVPAFLERHGPRTGCNQYGVAGYGDLGLALSFHHGSPNNTLPVLQWTPRTPDWNPLIS